MELDPILHPRLKDRSPNSKDDEAQLELGVSPSGERPRDNGKGFSITLSPDGERVSVPIELELDTPPLIDQLDPNSIGFAVLDPLGYVRQTWGLARKVPLFRPECTVIGTPLGALVQATMRGDRISVLQDSFRLFNSISAQPIRDINILVVNAAPERVAIQECDRATRTATVLRRLGKALTMDQTIEPMCISAAHEIASALELAAVMVWVLDPETEVLELVTSVGVNRFGVRALSQLIPVNGQSCVAERVANTQKVFELSNVMDHPQTAMLEAKSCYLKAGGVSIHPLESSDKLLGVVEFVGREGDLRFGEDRELFETIAEHLALALNSAQLFETFERLASRDALTGLSNHRTLQEFVHHRLAESNRTAQTLGIAMIDVDHFRAFNEEEGHDAGDAVLKLVADALRSCVRPYDLAARYGGEEFTVAMPGATEESILLAAERMRAKVEAIPFVNRQGIERRVTISIGCSVFPGTATEPGMLLKAADEALYAAKRSGRNRVVWYNGVYGSEPVIHRIDFDFSRWMTEPEIVAARESAASFISEFEALLSAIGLSPAQRRLLEGLFQVGPRYEAEANPIVLAGMQSSDELRPLLPNLIALGERFDQSGERIPLLSRIYQVLMAIVKGSVDDPGRLDPKILALAQSLARAA